MMSGTVAPPGRPALDALSEAQGMEGIHTAAATLRLPRHRAVHVAGPLVP